MIIYFMAVAGIFATRNQRFQPPMASNTKMKYKIAVK
jgi:hypothetical protein